MTEITEISDLHSMAPDSRQYDTLGSFLEDARRRAGLSREKFSLALGLSASALQQIVKGYSGVGPKVRAAVHAHLGVPWEEVNCLADAQDPTGRYECLEPGCVRRVWRPESYCEAHFSIHRRYRIKTCEREGCDREYEPLNSKQRHCSTECRDLVRRGDSGPVFCACGCEQMTSDKVAYRNGEWEPAQYIKGHNIKGQRSRRRRERDVGDWPHAAFVMDVRAALEARERSFAWLQGQTGVARERLVAPHKPRPETIVRVVDELAMDLGESMAKAGWPKPRPMALAVIALLRTMSREEIADYLRISRQVVDTIVNGTKTWWRPPTVRQIGARLNLPKSVIDEEVRLGEQGHSEAMSEGAKNRPPDVVEKCRKRFRRINEQRRRKKRFRTQAQKKGSTEAADKRTRDAHRRYERSWQELERTGQASITQMVKRFGYKRASVREWRELVDRTVPFEGG